MDRTDAEGTVAAAAPALAGFRRRVVGQRAASPAAETARLYLADWARFAAHCRAVGAMALPATSATVAGYLALSEAGRAALRRRLAAIDHQHRRHGLPCPGDDASVRAARQGARRRTRPTAPSDADLRAAAGRCGRDLAGLRDRAVLLLVACGLSRSEIVALQAEQLRWAEDGVRAQHGTLWLPRLSRHDHCPCRALEDWLRASATRYGPVFRKVTRWGTVEPQPLGTDAIRRILLRRGPRPGAA